MHVFEMELKRDRDGRIVEKTETVAGTPATWKYVYDGGGRLTEAYRGGRLICQCHYDREGRRSRDYFPATVGTHYRDYRYTLDNRLLRAGNNTYTHDDNGFRSIWAKGATYLLYEYAPDYRLLRMEIEDQNRVYTFDHDENGQRIAKYCNGQLVEAYHWLDFVRLGGFHDGQHAFEFAYRDDERIPFAMRRDDGTVFGLFSDQVGSLRVVVDSNENMIKEIVYDPFGGIIEDTNPDFHIPIGFAGGLHDRDLGFVRFGWRDYDTFTGRWTAPDPIGDKGGDPDWYGYCLDDPVDMIDASGLAYAGNDFGPGYDGTSGSAYGPTAGGWGYNSDLGGSHDNRNKETLGGGSPTSQGNQAPSTNQISTEQQQRAKVNTHESQEIENTKRQAEKARQARDLENRLKRQRRAALLASGERIVKKALSDGAKWAGVGAAAGSVAPGIGTLGGSAAGGVVGFSTGLLKGTINEAVDKSDLSESTKEAWSVIDSLW